MRLSVWVVRPPEINFYQPVISYFDANLVDIMVDTSISPLEYSLGMVKLQDSGFRFFNLDTERIADYKNIVLNSNLISRRGLLYDKIPSESQCIALKHSVDAPHYSYQMAAHWFLGASQWQVECPESNKVSRSQQPELFKKLMSLPMALRNEYAYSGPYHLGEWLRKRQTPKAELQQELEKFIGCSFDGNKPVVAFLQDEFCHERQVADALRQLSQHVNLVVKPMSPSGLIDILSDLSGIFFYPNNEYSPNLLRFASDFILAGYHSGTLASSTMLGLSVIPYYTSTVFLGGRVTGKRSRHTVYLKNNDPQRRDINVEIVETLNPPVNLQDTEKILERIYDRDWWRAYQQRLPGIQKSIFGDYDMNNAAERTAELVLRVFERETFGDAVAAVRLRPEFGNLVKSSDRGRKDD